MSIEADSATSEEIPVVADDAQTEAASGSPHFNIGDDPPGMESLETEAQASAEVSEQSVKEEALEVEPQAAPAEPFFEFQTADGNRKQFQSAEDAQQFFSSWNGRLAKASQDIQEATQANFRWQQAYEDGSLFEHYQKEKASPKEEKAKPGLDQQLFEGVEWEIVNDYLKNGQSDKALQYIQYKNAEILKGQIEGLREEITGSIDGLTAPQRFASEAAEAMTYVAELGYKAVDDMGQPLFPEFQDGATYDKDFVHHFRDIWLNQDVNLAVDTSLTGFRAAYYEAKATYQPKQQEVSSPPAPQQAEPQAVTPRNPDGTFAKKNAALAMSGTDGSNYTIPTQSKSTGSSILDGLRNANKSMNKHFAVVPD